MIGGPSPSERSAREPLTRAERIFVRISIWQTVLAVAGVFTGAVALYAALHESEAVRRQSASAVWPYVQFSINDHLSDAGAHFDVRFTNAGVGPAKITALKLAVDGEPVVNWEEALNRVLDRDVAYGHQFANGRVLRAGETIQLMSVDGDAEAVAALQTALYGGRAQLEYCYCSIFDDCWVFNAASPSPRREIDGACPDYGADAFVD